MFLTPLFYTRVRGGGEGGREGGGGEGREGEGREEGVRGGRGVSEKGRGDEGREGGGEVREGVRGGKSKANEDSLCLSVSLGHHTGHISPGAQ